MAVTYGFFNSVNGDRKYNADQMSEYFRGIVSQGVFQHLDSGLAVSAGTGLSVSVAAGRAIIQDRWIQNSAALNLTISAASETYGRKDAVVIRLDKSSRAISITVKTGTPAASPVAPSMTRNATTYEMSLAYVNVAAGASSVTVTDKRSDSSVCGWAAVAQATSGEVDQMLNDMKTGFDGVEYSSPAAAINAQFEHLTNTLSNVVYLPTCADDIRTPPSGVTKSEALASIMAVKCLILSPISDCEWVKLSLIQRTQNGAHNIQILGHKNDANFYLSVWSKNYTDPNGLEWIPLYQYNNSGVSGYILVDWSEVTDNATGFGGVYFNKNHIIENTEFGNNICSSSTRSVYAPTVKNIVASFPSATASVTDAENSLLAVKIVMLRGYDSDAKYYVHLLQRTQGGAHNIQIAKVKNGTRTIVGFWSRSYTDNGLEWITVPQYQSSGISTLMLIDWSEVVDNATGFGSTELNLEYMVNRDYELAGGNSNPNIYDNWLGNIAAKVPSGFSNEDVIKSLKAIKTIIMTGVDPEASHYFIRALRRIQGGSHDIQIGAVKNGSTIFACVWSKTYTDSDGLEWITVPQYQSSGTTAVIQIDWSEVVENGTFGSIDLNMNHIKEVSAIADYAQSNNKSIDDVERNTEYASKAILAAMVTSQQSEQAPISIGLNLSHFIGYGQSWACGASTSDQYVISYRSIYNNLMFEGGVPAWKSSSPTKYDSFVPLREIPLSWGYWESPVSGQCEMVKQLLATENNYISPDYRLIGTAPGEGNKTIYQLSKGTDYYQYFMDAVTHAKNLADDADESYAVEAFSFINGTVDKAAMIQLQSDIDEDVKAITDQTKTVKMLTWQYEVHDTSVDYYDGYVGISNNIICAFPGYIIPHIYDGPNQGNNIHFTPEGSRIAGEYFGIVFKRIVRDGENWQPVKPESATISGNDILLTMHVPVAPLRFDTEIISPVANYGFKLFTSGGTEKTISSVTIQNNNVVKITCSESVNATDVLAYAYSPNQASDDPWGPENIARGQLCDSQKIASLTGRNLANFCVAFKKPISFWQ